MSWPQCESKLRFGPTPSPMVICPSPLLSPQRLAPEAFVVEGELGAVGLAATTNQSSVDLSRLRVAGSFALQALTKWWMRRG